MNKNIVCFDVETTGLNPQVDFIIQLAMVKIDAQTLETIDSRKWYIEPAHAYEITPGAFEANGLTKEFLHENGVSMKDIAQDIIDFVADSDYMTYNGNSFDTKFIYKDLAMFGYEFPMKDKIFYDTFLIYKKYYPCTLSAVYKRYTGKELEGAHDAFADVNGTIEVFKCIKAEQNATLEEWADMKESHMLSPEGSIRRASLPGEDEEYIVFAVGKYKDSDVYEIFKKDADYIKWFVNNVATPYTTNILREYVGKKLKETKK